MVILGEQQKEWLKLAENTPKPLTPMELQRRFMGMARDIIRTNWPQLQIQKEIKETRSHPKFFPSLTLPLVKESNTHTAIIPIATQKSGGTRVTEYAQLYERYSLRPHINVPRLGHFVIPKEDPVPYECTVGMNIYSGLGKAGSVVGHDPSRLSRHDGFSFSADRPDRYPWDIQDFGANLVMFAQAVGYPLPEDPTKIKPIATQLTWN